MNTREGRHFVIFAVCVDPDHTRPPAGSLARVDGLWSSRPDCDQCRQSVGCVSVDTVK